MALGKKLNGIILTIETTVPTGIALIRESGVKPTFPIFIMLDVDVGPSRVKLLMFNPGTSNLTQLTPRTVIGDSDDRLVLIVNLI